MAKRRARQAGALGVADLHVHTLASDGLNSAREVLDYVEEKTSLDVIAITDHDHIEGALEARDLCAKGDYSFDVVVGEEVTTLSGHLLALDITKCVRMFQSLEKTIADIHSQGGLAVIPHPLAWFSAGLRRWRIATIMQGPAADHFDGIETFNPSIAGRKTLAEAIELAHTLDLAALGGSDSHCLATIASARTLFPGQTWQDLRSAIIERETQAEGEFWELSAYTDIALPQAVRSLLILPGKRVKKMASWFLQDHGLMEAE